MSGAYFFTFNLYIFFQILHHQQDLERETLFSSKPIAVKKF